MEGVTPSCQLQVSYRAKSTFGSYSTDGLAAARSRTSRVINVTLSPPVSTEPEANPDPRAHRRPPTRAPRGPRVRSWVHVAGSSAFPPQQALLAARRTALSASPSDRAMKGGG